MRDGAAHLEAAVASVRSQTHDDVELIVVDDGSTDDSLSLAGSLDIDRLIALGEHRGVSTARNVGVSVASGEFISFLDADDRIETEKIQRQLEFLRENPECGCVLTGQRITVLGDIALPDWLDTLDRTVGRDAAAALPISLLTRTESLYRSGGFDPTFTTSEEMDLLLRLERSGTPVRELNEPLVLRTVHGSNASYQTVLMQKDLIRAMRKLKRRDTETVSVVIPIRDGARYLEEAVQSVLAQDVSVEVVVVDDGSTDDTPAIAAGLESSSPCVRVISQPRLGIGGARNHGVLVSHGALIAFLDSDDVWLPSKLRESVELLEENPNAGAAHGWVEEFVSPGETTATRAPRPPTPGPLASDIVVRRTAFSTVGPFSLDEGPEWVEWWTRALEVPLTTAVSPRIGTRRRLHDSNRSTTVDPQSYLAVIRGSLRRRQG